MYRPQIAILPSIDGDRLTIKGRYLAAIWEAGGVGVVLEPTTDAEKIQEYASMFDGFLISGGVDIDPKFYGEEKKFDNVEIDSARDAFESLAIPAFFATGKPMLGICRGLQAMNVFLGGTLYQHIDGHKQTESGDTVTHAVDLASDGLLYDIVRCESIAVNTFHHQAIKDLSTKLCIDACSHDGYIEAVHAKDRKFCLGVQWHPEIYRQKDENMQKLFLSFVNACK